MQTIRAALYNAAAAAGKAYTAITPKRALSDKGRAAATQHSPKLARGTTLQMQYEACVIGDTAKRVQGNCVICHGTLLYLGEKQLNFKVAKFLDEALEDPWVKQVCPGEIKMPMLHALGEEDRWLCGTEAIWSYVEEHHQEAPDLGRPLQELSDGVELGQLAPGLHRDRISSLLTTALTSTDAAEAAQAMNELGSLLRQLDDWLAEREMPFLGGDAPNATDCYLAPKLNHAVVALGALRGWELPEDLQALHRYLVLWRERPSWQQSHFEEGLALAYWQRKVNKAKVGGGQQVQQAQQVQE